mgnify:CR=1 FL=1
MPVLYLFKFFNICLYFICDSYLLGLGASAKSSVQVEECLEWEATELQVISITFKFIFCLVPESLFVCILVV